MKKIILVHRWEGDSESDWYPWLQSKLEDKGYEVVVPNMPDTEVPVIDAWVGYLSQIVGTPDQNTYFVGHSIGCQTILRYLEIVDVSVGGAVFVAGWFNLENLENEEMEEIARPWIETSIDTEKVKSVLPQSTLIISDNDPYGCLKENRNRFGEFVSKEKVIPSAGHFTNEDGFIEPPLLLDEIEDILFTKRSTYLIFVV